METDRKSNKREYWKSEGKDQTIYENKKREGGVYIKGNGGGGGAQGILRGSNG